MRTMKIIAHIHTDFPEKFAIPRQSGLADTVGRIVFEPEYAVAEALRGIEEYSHLWLIWEFSEAKRDKWSPTVRPPRLGGNKRVGVFATRSPFRPNPIGLSSVELIGIENTNKGQVLLVKGADMMDGTPIYDIKPYLSFTDSHPEAKNGFAEDKASYCLEVDFPENLRCELDSASVREIISIISQDPRPAYIEDSGRVYGFSYKGIELKFRVEGKRAIVCDCNFNEM